MNWNEVKKTLFEKGVVSIRPSGNSMSPRIENKNLVTIERDYDGKIEIGDIVFCKVMGRYYIHKVSAIRHDQIQISSNKGHVNGWTTRINIYGKVVKVEK